MSFNIGPTITVQGEAQFNQSMMQLRQNMKYVNAEAAASMSVFDKNEKSVESLTAKNSSLTKALAELRRGEQEAKDQLKTLTDNGLDPASEKYKQLKANLDNVTASANLTELEIKQNKEEMSKLNETSSGLGDTVKKMAEKFGVALPAGAAKGIAALNKVSASTVALAAASVKMIGGLVKATIQASETADEVLELASTTGLTTDKIQELQYSAELLDVSFETISGSMTKMIKSMSSARDGSGEAAKAYKELGIDVTGADGKLRDVNEVFYETIDKLSRMKNETERDALAMAIFGKSARELNPLIEAGSEKVKELAEEAHNMSYVISKEALEKLGSLNDSFKRFDNQGKALKNTLAIALLPVLTAVMEVVSSIPPGAIAVIAVVGTVIVTIITTIQAVKSVTGVIDAFSGKTAKTTLIVLGVVAALIALATIIAVISGKGRDLRNAMNSVGSNVSRMTDNVPRYASGTSYHPGGPAIINDGAGPELVDLPRGSKVYTAEQTKMILAGTGGGDTYHITIDAKNVREFNDIVRMAKGAQLDRRAGRG